MPLILTLKLDETSFANLNKMREQYFPRSRNFVPAHVTLFHALPDREEQALEAQVAAACSHTPALNLVFPAVRSLGSGVAVEVSCAALMALRKRLVAGWWHWLGRQDKASYRPHVTIQNKVRASEARRTLDILTAAWRPFDGTGLGLQLWRYMGGPWDFRAEHLFDGHDDKYYA